MRGSETVWARLRANIICGLTLPGLLSAIGPAFSAEPAPVLKEKAAPKKDGKAPKVEAMSLQACRHLALERAPAIAAAQASLAAAVAREQAVKHLGFTALLSREMPIRREQAGLGVAIAAAAVTQAEWDTLHGVTYSYLSILYARNQLAVADKAIKNLKELRKITDSIFQSEQTGDLHKENLKPIEIYLLVAEGRRAEATTGEERALSALREAIGLDAECPLEAVTDELATAEPPARDALVSMALARRGEIAQVVNAAQVNCLEISAQQRSRGLKANTFAIASDIHAREVPESIHSDGYRPGALALEMPALLPGCKTDRVNQAQAYYSRTEAVVEKTQKLIALEVEQAYLRWQENVGKGLKLAKAAKTSTEYSDRLLQDFRGQINKPTYRLLNDVLTAGVTEANNRLLANEAKYRRLLGLAELEHATAGGFDPGWVP